MVNTTIKRHRVFFKHTKKVKPLKRTRYGYSVKRKFKRTFNGRVYTRVGQYRVRTIVDQIKERYHKQGYYALVIPSSKNFQLWIAKKEGN
jgi:hypothetical protein